MSSAATCATGLMCGSAPAENSVAVTTSSGRNSAAPRRSSVAITSRAVPSKSGSHSERPIALPLAARKVLAMPPPTTSSSTFSASDFRIASLVDTLAPPTMAASGRCGCDSARVSARSSEAISGPAQAIGARRASASVVASARCAVPKASFT